MRNLQTIDHRVPSLGFFNSARAHRDNSRREITIRTNNINKIFLKFLGRPPTEQENKKSIEFIKQDSDLAKLIQIIICTGEFRNVK